MTQTVETSREAPGARKAFMMALIANFVWVNASETWRYFAVVKPMLNAAYPGNESVAAVTPAIFASWVAWDTVLILAGTGFFWLYMERQGRGVGNALVAATLFTVTVFGLLWLGLVNMGLVPVAMIWAALPLAWLEQAVAALIVWRAMKV